MDDQTKQCIKNIVSLVKQRKVLIDEINSLDDYKKKIELVKQKYVGKNRRSKNRRTTKGGGTK